jgi:subtilisin family serine protease
VRKSAAKGVFYSIAAGNDGKNACQYSPARAGAGTNNGIMTVAATRGVGTEPYKDAETSWSNYGSCVDIWEPGASILSTKRGGGTTKMSGTSMAAPHTGGAAALYLSAHTGSLPAEVEEQKKADAVFGENRNRNPKSKGGSVIKLGYAGKY